MALVEVQHDRKTWLCYALLQPQGLSFAGHDKIADRTIQWHDIVNFSLDGEVIDAATVPAPSRPDPEPESRAHSLEDATHTVTGSTLSVRSLQLSDKDLPHAAANAEQGEEATTEAGKGRGKGRDSEAGASAASVSAKAARSP